MSTYLIFDLIVLAVLILFAALGAHQGLILSLCGLIAVVVAVLGASFAARALSPLVADALEPRFAAAIEEQLNESLREQAQAGADALTPEEVPLSGVLDALREMGFYERLIDQVDQAVEAGMAHAAASAAAQVAAAVAQSAAYAILFLAAFLFLLIVWKLISHALDLVARLPGLHFLNKTGGALFGLIQACILLWIALWLLQFWGDVLPRDAAEHTRLLAFFLTHSPLSLAAELF